MSDVLGAVAKATAALVGLDPDERKRVVELLALSVGVELDGQSEERRRKDRARKRGFRGTSADNPADIPRTGDESSAKLPPSAPASAPSLSDLPSSVSLSSSGDTSPEAPREGAQSGADERFAMPTDWPLSPEASAMVAMVGVRDIPGTWGKFVAYWHARGDANTQSGWLGLWARKWCPDERNRQQRMRPGGTGARPGQPAATGPGAWQSSSVSLDDEPPVAAAGGGR